MSEMPRTAAADPYLKVQAEVKAGKVRPLYILFGPDVVAADSIIELLKKTLLAPGLEAFDLETIHAPDIEHSDLTAEEIVQRTRQLPFGSLRRLTLIRNIDAMTRRSGSRLHTLLTALADTPDSSAVVLTCNPGSEWRERRSWLDFLKACRLKDLIIDLRPPEFERLLELVRSGASRRRLTIEPDAAALLVEIVGGETGILRGELDKLATAFEPGTKVTAADIRRLAGPSREFGLDEFVRHFLNRDPAGLAVLRRVQDLGTPPVQTIVWLTTGLLNLLALKSGTLPARERWKLPDGCERCWSTTEVDLALRRLYRINYAAVTGHPEPEALLELLTAKVCMRSARGRKGSSLVG